VIDTFLMISTNSGHLAKFGEDRTMCAGCRCENMVVVCLFLILSRSEAGTLFIRGARSLNKYCVVVYGSILILFSPFFGSDCPFRCIVEFSFSYVGGVTIFLKLRKKLHKVQKSEEKFVRTTLCR